MLRAVTNVSRASLNVRKVKMQTHRQTQTQAQEAPNKQGKGIFDDRKSISRIENGRESTTRWKK